MYYKLPGHFKVSVEILDIKFLNQCCIKFLTFRLCFNPLRAAIEKSGQCGTSSSHGGRENSTEKHQPVSEDISWEPRIVSSHTAPQKIAKKISFQMTENDMMVA